MCVCVCMLYHFAVLSTLVFWLLLEEDDVDGVVDALEQQLGVVAHDLALLRGLEGTDERLDCIHSASYREREGCEGWAHRCCCIGRRARARRTGRRQSRRPRARRRTCRAASALAARDRQRWRMYAGDWRALALRSAISSSTADMVRARSGKCARSPPPPRAPSDRGCVIRRPRSPPRHTRAGARAMLLPDLSPAPSTRTRPQTCRRPPRPRASSSTTQCCA
jgi:hypothetical protein